jgi:monofunctional biosynthetic peptidoglycan transglycosylase
LTISTIIITNGLFFAILLSAFGSWPESFDPEKSENDTEVMLIDFSNTSAAGWQILNDSVMGGISRSTLQMHEDGYALFTGTVSLENNGGFASVRTRAQRPVDLSDYEGFSVHVLGDGKTYILRIRTVKNRQLTRYSYEARFATTEGEWETHKLAYSDFTPVFRGNSVRGIPEFNPDAVLEIGFMIRDGQEGPFRMGVRSLSVYR